jgi:hypothetical protein
MLFQKNRPGFAVVLVAPDAIDDSAAVDGRRFDDKGNFWWCILGLQSSVTDFRSDKIHQSIVGRMGFNAVFSQLIYCATIHHH